MNNFTTVSGYGFSEDGSFINLDHHENGVIRRELFDPIGKSFTIKRELGRYCTGQFDLATLKSDVCPNASELLSPKASICFDCFDFIGFNPAFYHLEMHQISPQQRAYNQTEHIVYLAYFAPGLIKVGISSNARKEHRWKEQGARFVAHIYTVSNAYEARHIEEMISTNLKLPEVVLAKKKRELLIVELNFDRAREEFDVLFDQIDDLISTRSNRDAIIEMDKYYKKEHETIAKTIIDVSDHADAKISGRCLGLYGDIVLFENGKTQFMFSLKKMISYRVSFSERVEEMNFQPQQISLF